MIPRNLKPGDTFADGPLFYKVLKVNGDGSYLSTRVETMEEPEEVEPEGLEENAENAENAGSEPEEVEPEPVEKKTRGGRRK